MDLVNSVIILLSQMILLKWLNFLIRSLTVTLNSPGLLDLFLLMPVFVLQWLSLCWEILIVLCQFPLTFQETQNRMLNSSDILRLFLC